MKNFGSSMASAVKSVIDERLDRFWEEHRDDIRGQLTQLISEVTVKNENVIKTMIDERLDRFWNEHQDEIRQQVSKLAQEAYGEYRDDLLESLKKKLGDLIEEKEAVIDRWMQKAVQTQTRNVVLTVCGFLVTVMIFLLVKIWG